MNAQQVKKLFQSLSMSQGLYGRLLRDIEATDDPKAVYEEIGKDCKDDLDVIFKIEC